MREEKRKASRIKGRRVKAIQIEIESFLLNALLIMSIKQDNLSLEHMQ